MAKQTYTKGSRFAGRLTESLNIHGNLNSPKEEEIPEAMGTSESQDIREDPAEAVPPEIPDPSSKSQAAPTAETPKPDAKEEETVGRSSQTDEAAAQKPAAPTEEKQPDKKNEGQTSLASSFFRKEKQKIQKNSRTFYLEDDVYHALEALAKDNGISASEALNTILKEVL